MDILLSVIIPVITDLAAAGLVAILGLAGVAIRRYFGLKAEQVWRDALHQALETGTDLIDDDIASDDDLDTAAGKVVAYVKRSVPEAVAGLKGSDEVLMDLAKSRIARALDPDRLFSAVLSKS